MMKEVFHFEVEIGALSPTEAREMEEKIEDTIAGKR